MRKRMRVLTAIVTVLFLVFIVMPVYAQGKGNLPGPKGGAGAGPGYKKGNPPGPKGGPGAGPGYNQGNPL